MQFVCSFSGCMKNAFSDFKVAVKCIGHLACKKLDGVSTTIPVKELE